MTFWGEKKMKKSDAAEAGASFTDFSSRSILVCSFGALRFLVAFLIAAGIIAAIVFVLVWISEKLLPHEWFGGIMLGLFEKIGLKGAAVPVEETNAVIPVPSEPVATEQPPPPPPAPSEEPPET